MTQLSKPLLRQQLRQARRALTQTEQIAASEQIAQQIAHQHRFDQSSVVAVYLCADGEVNLSDTIKWLRQCSAQVLLPIVQAMGLPLQFARYQEHQQLAQNHLGILEPVEKHWVPTERLTHVLMPLVGFDTNCHRLGMGGGFYDRTFDVSKVSKRPTLIGVAHECQKIAVIPTAAWDVPLDCVITPSHCYRARR